MDAIVHDNGSEVTDRAQLGLIATTDGNNRLWTITDYGDAYMNKLLAVHRTPGSNRRSTVRKRTRR